MHLIETLTIVTLKPVKITETCTDKWFSQEQMLRLPCATDHSSYKQLYEGRFN